MFVVCRTRLKLKNSTVSTENNRIFCSVKIQEQLQDESRKQSKEIFIVEEISQLRDKMIADLQKRMRQEISKTPLFTINWNWI